MRLGTSNLARHKKYLYNDNPNCPICNEDEKETNDHYLNKCKNYEKHRKIMHTEISKIYPNVAIKDINDNLLLTTNDSRNKEIQKLIILDNYIEETKRFQKNTMLKKSSYINMKSKI